MNYNLVADTSMFKPFDIGPYLQVLLMYNTLREKDQAVYDAITQSLGNLASAVEGTKDAKKIYDDYHNRLIQATENFALGRDINTARELYNLRTLYGTQIKQLEKALEAMAKEAERRRTEKDPTMMYETIGNLDTYLQNPDKVYGRYSGAQLTNEVSAMSKAASLNLIRMENDGRLDAYTRKWKQTKGFNPDNIARTIAEVEAGGLEMVTDPIHKSILTSALNSSGINNWASNTTKKQAEIMAARGLYGGVGDSTMGTYQDKAYEKEQDFKYKMAEKALDFENQLKLLDIKNKLDLKNTVGGVVPVSYLNEPTKTGETRLDLIKKNISSMISSNGRMNDTYIAKKQSSLGPMLIYNLYREGYNNIVKRYNKNPLTFANRDTMTSISEKMLQDITDYTRRFKLQYGVTSILSTELYNTLKLLGYGDSELISNGYNMTDYANKLNELAQRNVVSYLNGTKISEAAGTALSVAMDRSNKSFAKEFDIDSPNSGKEISVKELTEALGDKNDNVSSIGVDVGKEKIICVLKGGRKLSIDPMAFGATFAREWETYMNNGIGTGIDRIPGKVEIERMNISKELKNQLLYNLQETLTYHLGETIGRGYFQVLPESKLE